MPRSDPLADTGRRIGLRPPRSHHANDPTSIDVVVVEAGRAGLRAAGLLHGAGQSVVVIEARDRVGGRLQSGGHRFDLGATWFWPNERRVSTLVTELNLDVFAQRLGGDMMYQPSTGQQRVEGNQFDVASGRFDEGAQSLPEALVRLLAGDVHAGAAATPVWMGGTVNVVARYERPFWRDGGLAGSAFSHVGPLRQIHDVSGRGGEPAALFGFAQPGPDAPAPERDAVLDQFVAPHQRRPATSKGRWPPPTGS